MVFVLIAKRRETADGKKWTNFSYVRGKKWYDVKFVKDCAPPQVYQIADGVLRAFIDLNAHNKYDIKHTDGRNSILFVENFDTITGEPLELLKKTAAEEVENFRKKRELERLEFIAPNDEDVFY